jgi:hypothetical protein
MHSGRRLVLTFIVLTATQVGCSHVGVRHDESPATSRFRDPLSGAHEAQRRALRTHRDAMPAWSQCAVHAHKALANAAVREEATALGNQCNAAWARMAITLVPKWSQGTTMVGKTPVTVVFRGLPETLGHSLELFDAAGIAIAGAMGTRQISKGWGVPMVARAPRCVGRPICAVLPPEGVFRPVTVWLEESEYGLRFVVANPLRHSSIAAGHEAVPLAADFSAPYMRLIQASRLKRLAIFGLLGGRLLGIHR